MHVELQARRELQAEHVDDPPQSQQQDEQVHDDGNEEDE